METSELLKQVHLFDDIEDELLQHFCKNASTRQIKKGEHICAPDDTARHFYIIKSGWVKLFRNTMDGQEAVLDVLTINSSFGETALFGKGTYSWYAEAVEDTTLLSIPTSVLKQAIEDHNTIAINMISAMASHRQRLDGEIERFMLQNAPQRVGCFLLKLVPNSAWDSDEPCPPISLPYNKSLVATRLGMTPETFSRALNALKKNTKITIKRSVVEIEDISSLSNYACQACSSFFPCKDDCEDE
ncbi:MAG: Crp/Fnr family transcriptional regulator [Cohaesibacter sp.]|nr:Crp/Fnr family transcriptional regulator [Cohaesibacter sp.]